MKWASVVGEWTIDVAETGGAMRKGIYEKIVRAALEMQHGSPWVMSDLDQINPTPEVCWRFAQECDPSAVRDWLRALGSDERAELLDRLNSTVDPGPEGAG